MLRFLISASLSILLFRVSSILLHVVNLHGCVELHVGLDVQVLEPEVEARAQEHEKVALPFGRSHQLEVIRGAPEGFVNVVDVNLTLRPLLPRGGAVEQQPAVHPFLLRVPDRLEVHDVGVLAPVREERGGRVDHPLLDRDERLRHGDLARRLCQVNPPSPPVVFIRLRIRIRSLLCTPVDARHLKPRVPDERLAHVRHFSHVAVFSHVVAQPASRQVTPHAPQPHPHVLQPRVLVRRAHHGSLLAVVLDHDVVAQGYAALSLHRIRHALVAPEDFLGSNPGFDPRDHGLANVVVGERQ